MAPLHTFLFLSSASLPFSVAARRTKIAEAEALNGFQTSTSGAQFRFFAASFNGANHIYTASEAPEILRTLTAGHEEPGLEADLVFLGLQEFGETQGGVHRVSLADVASGQTLWKDLSAQSGQRLSEELRRTATAPTHFHGQKAELAGRLAQFHGHLGAEVHAFTQHYGPDDSGFHSRLAEQSHVARLEEQSRMLNREVESRIDEVNRNVEAYKTEEEGQRFDGLRREAGILSDAARNYDTQEIMRNLGPIREWTATAMADIGAARTRYPNLVLSSEGQATMQAFLSSVNNVDRLQASLVDQQRMDQVTLSISSFHGNISQQVQHAETEMSRTLQQDLALLNEAVGRLMGDVRSEEAERAGRIASAAREGAESRQAHIRSSAETWASESRETLSELLQPASLDLTAAHLAVQAKGETWGSGWRCHSASHYDTTLHAFINPWSSWRISQVDYSSSVCRKTGGLGCTIDNNVGWECGKVVNLQVFEAEKEGATIRVCAMNTHMSFANTAADRMASIKAAVSEAGAANCDSVVFVGDFNSRLHCRLPEERNFEGEDLPPFMRLDPATNSSLKYLMDTFCTGNHCSISGPKRHWDELTQMLESSGLDCYEDGTDGWRPTTVDNTILATGLREAAPVDFSPTYKLKNPSRAAEHGEWARCLEGEPTCFVNTDRKGKHNPSWTDRVLLKSSDRVSLSTTEYSRRPVPASFHSDHIPVVARVTVEVV